MPNIKLVEFFWLIGAGLGLVCCLVIRGSFVFEGGVWDLLVIFFYTDISDFSGVV